MPLPDQLLLSDLLSRRVRCDRGLEHGAGQLGWMHPPVHRMLGWVSRPSALTSRRCVWRLDQLRGLAEAEVLVEGDPTDTDAATLERLPTLLGATLLSGRGEPLGQLADAAFERRTGRILHYLVARSDPRLPGGSRWRLTPDRIVDQRAGEVSTALESLGDLPLARASVREALLRRSRRWRDQWDEETTRLRDQWQQTSGRFEDRLEGWLEEPPWEEPRRQPPGRNLDEEVWPDDDGRWPAEADHEDSADFGPAGPPIEDGPEPWLGEGEPARVAPPRGRGRSSPWGEGPRIRDPGGPDPAGAWPDDDPDLPGDGSWPPRRASGPGSAANGVRRPPPPDEDDDPWV